MNNKNIKLKIRLISGDVVSLNGYSADTFRTLINASTALSTFIRLQHFMKKITNNRGSENGRN